MEIHKYCCRDAGSGVQIWFYAIPTTDLTLGLGKNSDEITDHVHSRSSYTEGPILLSLHSAILA